MKELFFSPDFRQEFDWNGDLRLRLGSVSPHNRKQISEGLRDMSPESIRNRFLGSKREFSEQELQYLTELDGWNHYALGIEERENLKRGVAIIRLVRASHNESEAEIAVTIIDDYQRKGLGTFLLDLTVLAALERKISKLSFTFLPQNEAIINLIKKAGIPYKGEQARDYEQFFVDISEKNIGPIISRWKKHLPVIETFHLET